MYQNLGISYMYVPDIQYHPRSPAPWSTMLTMSTGLLGSDATSLCVALVNQLVIKGFIQSLEIQIYTQPTSCLMFHTLMPVSGSLYIGNY